VKQAIGARLIGRLRRETGLDIARGLVRGGWGSDVLVVTSEGQHFTLERAGRPAKVIRVTPIDETGRRD
jgi:hypothetical protein